MQIYHFSLGNSTSGPIGFCAAIKANSAEEATERLKSMLQSGDTWDTDEHDEISPENLDKRNEYIAVYFNPDAVTPDDMYEKLTSHDEDVTVGTIRNRGWFVAVHNDYTLDGERHTFWLFTEPQTGRFVRAEGLSDQDALNDIARQIEKLEKGG